MELPDGVTLQRGIPIGWSCWQLMGATNYKEAAEGTIRADFATDIEKNVVHGSDAPDTAAFEISYFFNSFEIVG